MTSTDPQAALGLDEDQLADLTAVMVYGIVQEWVAQGIKPTTALMYAPFALIEERLGREAVQRLGVPDRSARYWRQQIRNQRDNAARGSESV